MSNLIYAIGDIHGHLDQLKTLHRRIADDQQENGTGNAKIIHIGDLTDRGPNTAGVLSYLIEGIETGQPWIVIRGNHDRMFQKFVEDPNWVDPRLRPEFTWLHPRLGGTKTLESYGIDVSANRNMMALQADVKSAVPSHHLKFLRELPPYFETPDHLFVHAGIRPHIAIKEQDINDLLWIREEFIQSSVDFGRLVVHGHTMVAEIGHRANRLNIDTGAGRGDMLSAVALQGRTVWNLTKNGRVLVPVAP